jgi:hypothetical protein
LEARGVVDANPDAAMRDGNLHGRIFRGRKASRKLARDEDFEGGKKLVGG